jgi:hypothetical protein
MASLDTHTPAVSGAGRRSPGYGPGYGARGEAAHEAGFDSASGPGREDLPLQAPEIAARLRRVENLANWMDAGFRLPVVGIRFGWDSVLGLVPGIGDALAALPALWILTEAHRMGARRATLARMAVNTAADVALGSIPILGDIADVALKANRRNVALLRRDMARGTARPRGAALPLPGRLPRAR